MWYTDAMFFRALRSYRGDCFILGWYRLKRMAMRQQRGDITVTAPVVLRVVNASIACHASSDSQALLRLVNASIACHASSDSQA
mmetsp:Transcript_66835/g.131744  ORF Transcript_66835/g.131744 Transcript_66835/m.131744 type:complete len:84 (-) Transcript_66835:12-263(-)